MPCGYLFFLFIHCTVPYEYILNHEYFVLSFSLLFFLLCRFAPADERQTDVERRREETEALQDKLTRAERKNTEVIRVGSRLEFGPKLIQCAIYYFVARYFVQWVCHR